jgi:hypothetical protein
VCHRCSLCLTAPHALAPDSRLDVPWRLH